MILNFLTVTFATRSASLFCAPCLCHASAHWLLSTIAARVPCTTATSVYHTVCGCYLRFPPFFDCSQDALYASSSVYLYFTYSRVAGRETVSSFLGESFVELVVHLCLSVFHARPVMQWSFRLSCCLCAIICSSRFFCGVPPCRSDVPNFLFRPFVDVHDPRRWVRMDTQEMPSDPDCHLSTPTP